MDDFVFPEWMILVIFLVLFVTGIAFFVRFVMKSIAKTHEPFKAEEALASELATRGAAVEGVVRGMARGGGSPREGLEGFTLAVSFEYLGVEHGAQISVWIEEFLAAHFQPGSAVSLLVDPADVTRVAVDRSRATVQVPLQHSMSTKWMMKNE